MRSYILLFAPGDKRRDDQEGEEPGVEQEGPGDLGPEHGHNQEHEGDNSAELAWLLMPQQLEPTDNLKYMVHKFPEKDTFGRKPHKVLIYNC